MTTAERFRFNPNACIRPCEATAEPSDTSRCRTKHMAMLRVKRSSTCSTNSSPGLKSTCGTPEPKARRECGDVYRLIRRFYEPHARLLCLMIRQESELSDKRAAEAKSQAVSEIRQNIL